MADDDFIVWLGELLSGLGRTTSRRMFGGVGIYHDGLIFGLVIDQRLYLKVDDETRAKFAAAGCEPFVYEGMKKPVELGYWSVPDEAMDSTDEMTPWARLAYAAALRKASAKTAKSKRSTKKPSKK
jgi:DNA transformation protein